MSIALTKEIDSPGEERRRGRDQDKFILAVCSEQRTGGGGDTWFSSKLCGLIMDIELTVVCFAKY